MSTTNRKSPGTSSKKTSDSAVLFFRLTDEPIDIPGEKKRIQRPDVGAVVCFEGRVREQNNDRQVDALEYSAYPELTEQVGTALLHRARERFDINHAVLVHRTGRLDLTECAVLIAVGSAHRKEAFRAGEWLIDETKKRLPVWKKEMYEDGSEAWINHPER